MEKDDRLLKAEKLEQEARLLRADYKSNPPEVVRTPYLIKNSPGDYSVGCRDEPQTGDHPYIGPCANVCGNADWVHICTDNLEGNAMIDRQALPLLIEALQALEAHLQRQNS